MISSCIWHSRSAQRRPWRSLSSSCSACARACASADFRRCATAVRNSRSRPAWVSASAFEVGDDCRAVDQFGGDARPPLDIKHHSALS